MPYQSVEGSRRYPRPYQRRWKGHYVDKHIEDVWLEQLNSLETLKLISICEGHDPGSRRMGAPHINLQMKDELLPLWLSMFDESISKFQTKLAETFRTDYAIVEAEFIVRVNNSCADQKVSRRFVVLIGNYETHHLHDFDDKVGEWFTGIISRIKRIDYYLKQNFTFEFEC